MPIIELGAPRGYDKALAEKRRSKFITMKHTLKEKMVLYHVSTKGQLDELKNLFTKSKDGGAPEGPYSLTEEVSKSGFYWTVLHYASHYGHYEVLAYLIDLLEDHPNKYDIFNLQTTEGKTPLFCVILSADIEDEEKKHRIIKLWFDTNCVDLSLRKKTGEDLLQLAQANHLYQFVVEYCLRED
jgi:hypothetical protein